MGVTADVVGVRMEADTTAYINNIKIAEGAFLNSMKKMGAEAVLTGNASAVAFQKTGNAALKTSKDTQVLSNSMKSLNGTTGNVAAQFNDIGVQLAGGQSPLLIALQQGTQLNQVFQQLKEGGGGIGSSLLGAFTQILNPISLATIGIIALGGYAVQYFMSIISEGGAANLTLKEQEAIIRAVADRWGDAVPALRDYANELDRVKQQTEETQAVQLFTDKTFETARKELDNLNIQFTDFTTAIQGSEEPELIIRLQEAFNELVEKIDAGKDATAELKKVQDLQAQATNSTFIPSFTSLSAALQSYGEIAATAAQKVAGLLQQMTLLGSQNLGQLSPLFSEDGKFLSGDNFTPGGNVPIPGDKPSQLGEYPGGGFNKPKAAKKDTEDSYESFTRKIKEQTSALEAETEAQAKVSALVTDYGFAADAARLYQEGLNAAKKAGVELGPAEQEQLRLLTEGLALVRVEQAKLDEEQKKTKQSFEAWNETAKSTVGGLIDDMLSGASAAEVLRNALGKVLDQLIEIGLNKVFDSKSGILSALFGAFTGGSSGGNTAWAGKRANGGPVSAGKPYLVGERQPEMFVPDRAGSIIPNVPNIGGPGGSGGSGGQITVRTFLDENGDWKQTVENIAGNVAVKHVKRSQAGEISRLPNNLKAVNQRGMIKGK